MVAALKNKFKVAKQEVYLQVVDMVDSLLGEEINKVVITYNTTLQIKRDDSFVGLECSDCASQWLRKPGASL